MESLAPKIDGLKMTMPPTPPTGNKRSSSLPAWSNANPAPSSPASDLQTPRERINISNRFWDKNASRTKNGVSGVDLPTDSSVDDDSEAARVKRHNNLDTNIKRMLALETGPVRLKNLATNVSVQTYVALLDAFAHKPKTKRKRARAQAALCTFLEDHFEILDMYNQYATLDQALRKDRILPTYVVDESPADGKTEKEEANDVRRAPAKNARSKQDESDEEGIVTSTVVSGDTFDEPSLFNTRGLTKPGLFNPKTSAASERNQRRFLLFKRGGGSLARDATDDEEEALWGQEEETPTRPSKKRKLA